MNFKLEKHNPTGLDRRSPAPGAPGVEGTWSSGAKTAVGTALCLQSRVWFTIAEGVLTEVFFPDVDRAMLRGLRFLVAEPGFFSDGKLDTDHAVRCIAPGVPAFCITDTCKKQKYRLQNEVITDSDRDALLLSITFEPLSLRGDLKLFVYADPHVEDRAAQNEAWTGNYKGDPMLFARKEDLSLAIACSAKLTNLSAGFIGKSDGLTDIRKHKRMTKSYTDAAKGNVGLTAEIDWRACDGRFRVAVAFGGNATEAGQQARAALLQEFSAVRARFIGGWQAEQATYIDLSQHEDSGVDHYRTSIAVIRTHESKRFPGGFVASLSTPWGFDRGDQTSGGYHVVWPRDLGETALALLASGDAKSARRALFYLRCTQEKDGNWSQNMWLGGRPNWTSTQMDGTCFGILIADALRRNGQIDAAGCWPSIKAAAGFLLRHGPVTKQDRWEANPGYSPYTMAVQIAALLAAADFADLQSQAQMAELLRATADAWNEAVDELTYVSGNKLARKQGIDGFYFRILPPEGIQATAKDRVKVKLKNHDRGDREYRATDIVSPDALALVRFGLRAATDPRILNTVKVIDATLKTETRTGPVWHRYTHDGYGEQKNGDPFHKAGEGRGWPLLTGERAHYEIAKGDFERAQTLRAVIEAQTSECGMIPEQIWDAADIPAKELYNGHPTGSGMPLVWAHAEYVKLLRSLREQEVWNMPPQTKQRYIVDRRTSSYQIWTEQQPRARLSPGKDLRIDSAQGGEVEWSTDGGRTRNRMRTTDTDFGFSFAVLPVADTEEGTKIQFAMHSADGERRSRKFEVRVG